MCIKKDESRVGNMHKLLFKFEMQAIKLLRAVSMQNGQRAKELSWRKKPHKVSALLVKVTGGLLNHFTV